MSKAADHTKSAATAARYVALVKKLAANGRLPFEPEAVDAMATALRNETANEDHASRAIDAANDAPTPQAAWTLTELRAFIAATNPIAAPQWNRNCSSCSGMGWIWVDVAGFSGVKRCPAGCIPRGTGFNSEVTR